MSFLTALQWRPRSLYLSRRQDPRDDRVGSQGQVDLLSSQHARFEACPLKPCCCPKTPQSRVPRDVDLDARDHAQTLMISGAYELSSIKRKKIETLFTEVKHILSRVEQLTHSGSITLNKDGSLEHTPDKDFVGTDSLTYRVDDGELFFGLAIVTIDVEELGDSPSWMMLLLRENN